MATQPNYYTTDPTVDNGSLHDAFVDLMCNYAEILAEVKHTGNYKHPYRDLISAKIPQLITLLADIQQPYKVVGSYGKGRWTDVPWIAIFDSRITTSAQRGVYIVYLLNKNTQELYLTFEVAATGVLLADAGNESSTFNIASTNSPELSSTLKSQTSAIQQAIPDSYFSKDDKVNSGASGYDSGAVYYKKYSLQDLPTDEELALDIQKMLDIYQRYYDWSKSGTSGNEWWPSLDEYDPGISKEQWLDLLRNSEICTENALKMLAEFYAFGGTATCAQLAEHYGRKYNYYLMTSVHIAEKVVKVTNCPVLKQEGNKKLWPVLYVGKDAASDTPGSYIWKIRDELMAALSEFGIETYMHVKHTTGHFDSWEIVDEVTAIKTCDKSFFEYNGSGVPKGVCWFFDAEELDAGETKQINLVFNGTTYAGKISNDTTDRRRVRIFWAAELGRLFEAYKAQNAVAVFRKQSDDTYELSIKGGEEELSIKEKVDAIKAYIAARGFHYEGDLIENFYLSLKSKPFVILAGTSGTGKTRLVKLFAEAIGAEMKLVPVRPDWSDSSDLFGHTDLSGHFHPGAIIDFIKQAEWRKDTPHFLCLDEMNLARVEYYLSDFLSVIETRDRKANGDIETESLVDVEYYQDTNAQKKYGRVFIPENLYIVGTVNMDETTFPFSKKVLDRANTIEFSFVNLMAKATEDGQPTPQKLDNAFLKTEFLYLRDCLDIELVDKVCFELEELNHILVKANLHVGYRVRDEISFYMANNEQAGLLSYEEAFDHEIMQKILPRIQGSSVAIKDVLSELFVKCASDYSGFSGATAYEQMNTYIESKSCKYPNSAKKIAFMMRRYEEDGFTSYWL